MVIPPLCVLLLAVTPELTDTAAPPDGPTPMVARSVRLLRDSRLPEAPPTGELVQLLRNDITATYPALIDLLVAGRVPALVEDESPQTLSMPQRDMILEAVAALPSGALLAQAERLRAPGAPDADERPSVAVRAVAARLLALGGGARSLPEVLSLATPANNGPVERHCADALEWSIETILAKDPRAARTAMRRGLHHAHEPLMPAILRALGDDGDPAGLEIVLVISERYPTARLNAFAQVRRLGASGNPELDEWAAALLGRHLDPDAPTVARSAALALGELSDFECVGDLIELLEESPASSEAHWALCRISGLQLAPDRGRWRHWYAGEIAFFDDSYEDCLMDLHGSDGGPAVAAIREISKHRLHRHELAKELAVALGNAPASRRRLLCNALEAMGSKPSAPALVPVLEDPDPAVVAAALRALRSLTDLSLPGEPEAWQTALVAL